MLCKPFGACRIVAAAWILALIFGAGAAFSQEEPAEPPPSTTDAAPEAEEVKPPPKRDDYIAKPGAPRKPLPDLFKTKPRSATEPRERVSDFERMRKNQTPPDPALVDQFAKAHVYKMTNPGQESDAVRDILNVIQTANDGKGNVSVEFLRAYKTAVIRHAADILKDNGALVQINALHLLNELQDGSTNVPDATPVFLSILADKERLDGVVVMALKGLSRAKLRGLVKAEEEQNAVELILSRLAADDIQAVLKEEMLSTLGILRRAYQRTPEDALAATRIAEHIINPNSSTRTRLEAGRALAQMDITNVQQWNSKLQASIIAIALQEFLDTLNEDSQRASEMTRYNALLWLDALHKGINTGVNRSDPDFQEFAKNIAIERILIPIVNRQSRDEQSLADWIAAHPIPEDRRLAPRAPAVTIPEPPPSEEPGEPAPAEAPATTATP